MKNFFKKLFCSDSMSKNFSETVQRIGKNNAGFSLVELIVVIAIMAILATVAVIGVSVYIPKAQKAGDQQTVNDVIDALNLYYYDQTNEDLQGYVILKQKGEKAVADANGAVAMEAMFGANWADSVSLQYADWKGETSQIAYANSSFAGKEDSLLNEVDRLTGALGSAVKECNATLGSGFTEFLGDYGLDNNSSSTEIGNAAVLYVAQNTADKGDVVQEIFKQNLNQGNQFVNETYDDLVPEIGTAAALAAIYAYAEGFAQYCDSKDPSLNAVDSFHETASFENTASSTDALTDITKAFGVLANIGAAYVPEYMAPDGPGMANVAGYVSIMGTVNDNKDVVDGNLSADDCFTDGTVESILNGYVAMGSMNVSTEDGQIAIVIIISNNEINIHVTPLNWDK